MTHSDGFLTATASLFALIFSQISASITDENFLKWVTAISSVVLCITAVIKLVDLCLDKIPKWSVAIMARVRRPKKPSP